MDMFYSLGTIIVFILMAMLSSVLDQVLGEPYPPRRKIEPRFLPTPANITVHRGELAVLKCHIQDLGPKIVVWRKKGVDAPLTIGADTFVEEDQMSIDVEAISETESHWDLLIKNVQLHHRGTYLCQVTASKLYTHYITLHVLDEPVQVEPDVVIEAETQYVNQGDAIKLTCTATGALRPPLEINWFLFGNPIVTNHNRWRDRTTISKGRFLNSRSLKSELIIEKSTLEDAGNYLCRSLDVGPTYKFANIFINVLNAGKEISRRDKANFAQSNDPSSSTWILTPNLTLLVLIMTTVAQRF